MANNAPDCSAADRPSRYSALRDIRNVAFRSKFLPEEEGWFPLFSGTAAVFSAFEKWKVI